MNNLGTKRLETERLILRRVNANDVLSIYNNWATDKLTNKYLDWDNHENPDITCAYVASIIASYKKGAYDWVVELKDTGELIGEISCVHYSKNGSYAEIGYCYGSKYWSHGYATEALRRVIEYLLNEEEFNIIEAKHISGNPASGRVMQKAGMKLDAVLRNRRINKDTKEINDLVIYSIVKSEL